MTTTKYNELNPMERHDIEVALFGRQVAQRVVERVLLPLEEVASGIAGENRSDR